MEFTHIKETCLYVEDLDRCQAFYEGKLGLSLISKSEGRHIFFRAGSSVLLCFIPEATKNDPNLPPHFGEGKLHLAFNCRQEEYQAWKSRVEEAGIGLTHEQEWRDGLMSFYFEDPDGHVLEIVMDGIWGDRWAPGEKST